ncbi:MAG TPA: hypothetical protein VGR07_15350, partial [Thermoanaerobaculia bacterium]|nr:hypothetical protein [Thermoanaerobaculia bacterium]
MRSKTCWMFVMLGLASLPLPLWGQSVEPRVMPPFVGKSLASAPPLGIAKAADLAPLAVLPLATEGAKDQLAALVAWNQAGRQPTQNGFVRPLPGAQEVRFEAAGGEDAGGRLLRRASGEVAWGARVEVQGAHRLRLHLKAVRLPADARLWVYGARESLGPFGLELLGPDGGIWLPSVAGSTASLEVVLPAGALRTGGYGFILDDVLEIVPVAAQEIAASA